MNKKKPVLPLSTLDEINRYIKEHEEFPIPDTTNLLNPDYSSFHRKITMTGLSRIFIQFLEKFHVFERPLWSAEDFKKALFEGLAYYEHNRPSSDYAVVSNATKESSFFIFGDLHGALHSFARDLNYLHKQGILTSELTIIHPDHFIILNGNALNLSPYTLETFTLVLNLINKNPENVIYIRGKHEDNNFWKEYGLKRELFIRARHLSAEKIPLSEEITKFFGLLPLSFYVKSEDQSIMQVSYYGFEKIPPSQEIISKIINSESKFITFNTQPKKNTLHSNVIKSLVKGADRSISYQVTDGLQMLTPELGVNTWSVLSAPTKTFKTIYDFHYDAFVLITAQKLSSEWTITLYNRDIEIEAQDYQKDVYNLYTGQKINHDLEKGIKIALKESLLLGCTLDLSKTSATLGKRLQEGLELRINRENQQGGINGHPLKLIFLDDRYTPRIAKQNIVELINIYKTTTILSPLGTPTTESFLPLAEEKKILILFPYTGAMIFRKPSLKNVLHLRTSYATEANALIRYAVEELQARKFAFFYQDDSYGRAPLFAARESLKNYGITEWLETSYLRNNPNIDEPAKKILDHNPDALLFFSTPAPSEALIRKLGINKVANTVFMGISFLTDVFRNFLRSKGLELIMARVVPNPLIPSTEIVQQYHDDMKKFNIVGIPSSDSLEGYMNADVLITVLQSIEDPITNDAIIEKIESIENLAYKGLTLNFDSDTRELLRDVWIDKGNGEWIHFEK